MTATLFGYVFINGKTQGKIEGGCEREEAKGSITLLDLNHDIAVNYDKLSRMAKGESIHDGFTFWKEWDKATPKLMKALIKGEHLSKVEVKWFRSNREGKYAHFFTHTMEDAHIVSMSSRLFNTEDPVLKGLPPHIERVAIAYAQMTWTWVEGNIEAKYIYNKPNT